MPVKKPVIALAAAGNPPTLSPPLALLCLSTVLKQAGFQTEVHDFTVHPEREEAFVARAASGAFAWVGLTGLTVMMPHIRRLVFRLRERAPGTPLLLGGMHASAVPEETLRYMPVDAVCVGPGEEPAKGFARKVEEGGKNYWEVPGLAALGPRGEYLETPRKSKAWAPLPRADWEAVCLEDYHACPTGGIRRHPKVAPVITTMGCPNACTFCSANSVFGRRLVHRDPVEVVDEIEYLVRERGVGEIHILDDNFNCNLKYAKSVLREWAGRGIQAVFRNPSGIWAHGYDAEWFSLLKETGCYLVAFGIESGSQEILKKAGKRIRLAEVPDIINMYESRGILTQGYFILGLPGESRETLRQTIDFACGSNLSHIHTSFVIPYPGCQLYRDAIKDGMMLNDWGKIHYYSSSMPSFCGLTQKQLKQEMIRFYLKFYSSRLKRAMTLAKEIRYMGIAPFASIANRVFLS
jgi:radical SAM superfamily enzyme YgiQ (UPF0313 family)